MSKSIYTKTTWDLSTLLSGDDDPKVEEKIKKVKDENYKFINKWKRRSDYLKDPKILKEALDDFEYLSANYGTTGSVGFYFWLRLNQEQDNPKIKARINKINDISTKIANDLEFFTHKISKIAKKDQPKFLTYKPLSIYKHFLERLFIESKYLLSEKEEKILNLKSKVSYDNWVDMVSEFLSKEEREVLDENEKENIKSFNDIFSLTSNNKKKVRDRAALAFNDILEKYIDVSEHEINSILENKKINDELRKFKRPDLARHLEDDIDTVVVDTLIECVTNNFDVSKRYYKLKAGLLGLDKLAYHERNVEYGIVDTNGYSFEKSVELVSSVFKDLDSEFNDIFQKFINKGRLDVFPKKGKSGGAFCVSFLYSLPTYVLLNHTDKLKDVTTLAHEMGHALNDEFMLKDQNSLNFGTPKSTAEVASTFFEDFILDELEKEASEETKLSIMMARLNDCISTIYRQVACYNFEKDLHSEFREKGYLSKKDIGDIFQRNMKAYMGEYVEQSLGNENWWVYWSHVRYFFYVYSYASGLLISKSLQKMVKEDKKNISKIKKFLGTGTSKSPKDTFLDLGIDITKKEFWENGLKEIEDLLNETEELAKKLGKI